MPYISVPYWIQDTDPKHVLDLTEKDVPIVRTLRTMFPQAVGFYPSLSNGNLYLIIAILALALFALPFIFIGISIIFTVRLQTIKIITSPQTFSMHKQLHK
uniref:Uncharacterized protein n=1 Tax=Panagrolaimus sp. ES5 TaxID=591445 RepID=A0AC34FM70_9BILA